MWDNLYNILFNPNHEMPVAVLIGIPIVVVVFNYFANSLARGRGVNKKTRDRITQQDQKKKK